MKNILSTIGSVTLLIFLVSFLWGCGDVVKNVPPQNDTIVVFGDSLVEGVGSTDGGDLVSLLNEKSDRSFINHGKSGDTTRDAMDRLDDVLAENAGVVVVILGGNDVLQKLPKEETFANLEKMIGNIQSSGSAVILVGVRSGVVGNGRDEDYKSVAKNTGALYVPDILKDVFGKRQYMSDTVHPNNSGYEIIADRLLPIIEGIYR